MRWRGSRSTDLRPAIPIDDVDPETLEVIELVGFHDAGRLAGLPRWPDDDSLREARYAARYRDGTGTAGIWEAIANG